VDGCGDEAALCVLCHDRSCCRRRQSLRLEEGTFPMKYVRAFFIVAGLLILGFGALHTKAASETKVQIVVVPGGQYDQVVLPPGEIVGFSCAAGITDVQPDCYILIK
jgi:hypothetical protein